VTSDTFRALVGAGRVSGSLWPSALDRMPQTSCKAQDDAWLPHYAYR